MVEQETRIFQSDQLKVHPDLAPILKNFVKEVIRNGSSTKEDILLFSKQYFTEQCERLEPAPPSTAE